MNKVLTASSHWFTLITFHLNEEETDKIISSNNTQLKKGC